jgi:HEAT repeat protein
MSTESANAKSPDEQKSVFGVIVHSFFIVPFLLAVFSVLLYTSVRILTMENRTAADYLEDVKVGGLTKRWQSAFELSKILANPKLVPQDKAFTQELIEVFEKSTGDDSRVRQYLALAMGRTGNPAYVGTLIKNIGQEKDENLTAIIYALGILRAHSAVNVLLPYLNDDRARVRLVTVMALGNIEDPKTLPRIRGLLNDTEPNVQWEAAIALAKNKDAAAKELLLKLLDRSYLSQFPEVDPEEQTHVMLVAVQASASLPDAEIGKRLEELFQNDKNMKVRSAAFEALKQHKKNS